MCQNSGDCFWIALKNVAIGTQAEAQMALLADCFLTHSARWVFYDPALIDK